LKYHRPVRPGIGDYSDIRPRYIGQILNLTEVVCTHFDNRVTMHITYRQQCHGHANVIIEIALRTQYLCLICSTDKNTATHFLDRGFAVTAGDTDNLTLEAPPPAGRQFTQCQPGVCHTNLRQCNRLLFTHQRTHGAGIGSLRNKLMAVITLTFQRNVQITLCNRARVLGYRGEQNISSQQLCI